MPFKLAELFVDITGRAAPLMGTLSMVKGSLLGIAGVATGLTSALSTAFIGLAGLGTAVVVGSVKAAADLEKQYAAIRKTTGLTGDEFNRLKRNLQGLATTMAGVSVEELNNVAGMAGRLGIQGVEGITAYTKAVAQIRIALDDIPAEEAATSIARILNVFHLGPEAALSFASALNKLDDSSTASGREILDVAQRLSGTAATLGLTPQKVLALAATLKDAGLENEVAGSAFSQILGKMATDTEDFAKVAGVSTRKFANILRADPLQAIQEVVKGMAKMERLEEFKALKGLGLDGVRTGNSLLQLSAVFEKIGDAVKDANEEWKSQASIQKEVAIQSENTWAQLQLLWNEVTLAAGSIGDFLLPVVKRLALNMREVGASIRAMVEDSKESLNPWIQWTIEQIDGLGVAWRNWEDTLALGSLVVEENLAKIGDAFTQLGEWIQSQWLNMIIDSFQLIGRATLGLIAQIGSVPGALLDALAGGEGKLLNWNPFQGLKMETEGFEFQDRGGGAAQERIEAQRKALRDRIAQREKEWGDEKAKRAAELNAPSPAQEPKPQKDGTGQAPEKDKKGKKEATHESLDAYVKRIQEGFFAKNKDKELLDVGKEQLGVQKQQLEALKNTRPQAAVAVGPA